MTQMMSFTKYENQILPKYRDQLNHAESVEDVKKFFIGTIQEFLSLATEGNLNPAYEDILLLPEESPGYSLEPQIKNSTEMKELENSDIKTVLQRLAEQAGHRHKHLMKNNTKTNLKIKNH
ncbi:MAG: hypothetical protein OEW99_14580 [Gammaproteobacteria bacterium]|nr:hypothetical protein [Gammaproteobacteria bacterium]